MEEEEQIEIESSKEEIQINFTSFKVFYYRTTDRASE